MTAPSALPGGHRLLAVIAPGDGPHLVGPPATVAHWTNRPARSRVSIAEELIKCLTMLEEDPEPTYPCAAASWHARWCIDLAPLTLTESQTALTALQAIAGARGTEAAGVLRYLCLLHGQRGTPEVLERWIAQREGEAAPAGVIVARVSAGRGATRRRARSRCCARRRALRRPA